MDLNLFNRCKFIIYDNLFISLSTAKMKLPIKKKYFDEIKSGKKKLEYRDAHITFVCEETGEKLVKNIIDAIVMKGVRNKYPDVLKDETTIIFKLK